MTLSRRRFLEDSLIAASLLVGAPTAFAALAWNLINMGATLIDCQIESEHLNSLGAVAISRVDFEERLAQTVPMSVDESLWRAPTSCSSMLEDLLPLLRYRKSPASAVAAASDTGTVEE